MLASLSESDARNILLYLFSTSAALMGFVLAAGTFLISHVKDEAFAILRQSKSFPQLVGLISSSIWRLFGLANASLLMLVAGPDIYVGVKVATVFFTVWAGLSLTSMTWIVMQILSVPTKP